MPPSILYMKSLGKKITYLALAGVLFTSNGCFNDSSKEKEYIDAVVTKEMGKEVENSETPYKYSNIPYVLKFRADKQEKEYTAFVYGRFLGRLEKNIEKGTEIKVSKKVLYSRRFRDDRKGYISPKNIKLKKD